MSILAVALCVPFFATVAAQDASAPAPSATENTFWAHHVDGDDEYIGFMNVLKEDESGDDIAMGVAQTCTDPAGAGVARPGLPIDDDFDVTWTLTYKPALTAPITLDDGDMAAITIYIGAGGGAGEGTVSTSLTQGETVIFTAEGIEHSYAAATAEYPVILIEVVPDATTIEPGVDLVWTVHMTGPPCPEAGPFLGVHGDRGKSNFVLPIIGGGAAASPAIRFHNETGGQVSATLEFDEATNETHQYNWTTTLTEGTFTYDANLTNGSVKFTVIDASDSNVVEGDLLESGNSSIEIADAAPGNWSVRVELIAFQGTFEFELGEAEAPSEGASGGAATSSAASNETISASDDSTPSPGLLVVLGALLVGTLLVSRRRRAL